MIATSCSLKLPHLGNSMPLPVYHWLTKEGTFCPHHQNPPLSAIIDKLTVDTNSPVTRIPHPLFRQKLTIADDGSLESSHSPPLMAVRVSPWNVFVNQTLQSLFQVIPLPRSPGIFIFKIWKKCASIMDITHLACSKCYFLVNRFTHDIWFKLNFLQKQKSSVNLLIASLKV